MAKPIIFEQVLAQKRKLVWREIRKYFKNPLPLSPNLKISRRYSKLVNFHWEITTEYPRRQGKYLRPTLVLLTAESMGVPAKKALRTAAAMQTSEDWILNHDDFEDNSLERRGKPALHRMYGPELAVNAGDALHIIMWKMLHDNFQILGVGKTYEILDEFYRMLTRTALGQTVEIKWTRDNKWDLTDEDIFFILDGKTVYYTIAGPMRLGAILGGANESQLEALYEFGKYLGRCFQIRDDLLDLTSNFSGLKKQRGNDIYEGKRTIMLLHLAREIKGKDKSKFLKVMAKGRDARTKDEVGWVIRVMRKYGSLEYSERLAEELAQKAREIFDKKLEFLSRQPARGQLRAGIDFILKREY